MTNETQLQSQLLGMLHFSIVSCFTTNDNVNQNIESVKKEINQENQVLVMCAAGGRSIIAANLLQNEGYNAHNISDGFSGSGQDLGWKNSGLPTS